MRGDENAGRTQNSPAEEGGEAAGCRELLAARNGDVADTAIGTEKNLTRHKQSVHVVNELHSELPPISPHSASGPFSGHTLPHHHKRHSSRHPSDPSHPANVSDFPRLPAVPGGIGTRYYRALLPRGALELRKP